MRRLFLPKLFFAALLLALSPPAFCFEPCGISLAALQNAYLGVTFSRDTNDTVNPIDPTVAFAWPMYGKKLKKDFTLKNSAYQVFWGLETLDRNSTYLAKTNTGKLVRINKIKYQDSPYAPGQQKQWVERLNAVAALLNHLKVTDLKGNSTEHPIAAQTIIDSFEDDQKNSWTVTDYIPGIHADDMEMISKTKSLSKIYPVSRVTYQALNAQLNGPGGVADWARRAYSNNWLREINVAYGLSPNEQAYDFSTDNWMYFNGVWYLVDFSEYSDRLRHL